MRPIVLLLAVLALTAAGCDRQKPEAPQGSPTAQAGPTKGVDRSHRGDPAPETVFKDPDGDDVALEEFQGTPVLVNLWASWCVPCIKELPTLDALAKSHKADGALEVIAVSQDMAPQNSVRAFLAEHKISQLGAYQDGEMALSSALNAEVLPSTVLYDKNGRELWRFTGDLDWTGAEAKKLLAEAR